MEAESCDGGDGENIVDSFSVGGFGKVNACHYEGCCFTVFRLFVHTYRRVMVPMRHDIRIEQTSERRLPNGHDWQQQQHSGTPSSPRWPKIVCS